MSCISIWLVLYLLSLAHMQRSAKEDDKVPSLLRKLDAVCELRARVQEACDCSILYWHKVGSIILLLTIETFVYLHACMYCIEGYFHVVQTFVVFANDPTTANIKNC